MTWKNKLYYVRKCIHYVDMIKALCVYNLNLQPLIAKKNFLIMNSLALTFDPKTINEFVLESLSLKRKKMSTLLQGIENHIIWFEANLFQIQGSLFCNAQGIAVKQKHTHLGKLQCLKKKQKINQIQKQFQVVVAILNL